MKKFFYRVQKNQTIVSISNMFNVCTGKIIEDNLLKQEVYAGQVLYLESQDCNLYTVKPEDTLSSICKKFNRQENEVLQENNLPYLFCGVKIKV